MLSNLDLSNLDLSNLDLSNLDLSNLLAIANLLHHTKNLFSSAIAYTHRSQLLPHPLIASQHFGTTFWIGKNF
jgi:hypothetical protein